MQGLKKTNSIAGNKLKFVQISGNELASDSSSHNYESKHIELKMNQILSMKHAAVHLLGVLMQKGARLDSRIGDVSEKYFLCRLKGI